MIRRQFRALLNLAATVPRVGAVNLRRIVDVTPWRARAPLTARDILGIAWMSMEAPGVPLQCTTPRSLSRP
jgi:hypothetical protein